MNEALEARFEGQVADLEQRIASEMTPEQASELMVETIDTVNFYFETGSESEQKRMEELFQSLKKRLFAISSEGGENSEQFRDLYKKMRVYENFIAYGRKTSKE